MTKLTGNKRYRVLKQLWRKPVLVLEVEYTFEYDNMGFTLPETGTAWRDATVQDLTQFKE